MVTPASSRPAMMFVVVGVLVALAIAAALAARDGPVRETPEAVTEADVRAGLEDAKARMEALLKRFVAIAARNNNSERSRKEGDEDFANLVAVPHPALRIDFKGPGLVKDADSQLRRGETKRAAATLEKVQMALREMESLLDRMEK